MGKHEIRLCEHLVTSYYGPASGHVASILLHRGRLPLLQIVKLSSLPIQTVRAALVVLVQQHCVYHSFVGDPSPSSQPEHFEANIPEMLARIRFGKYVALALECFGQEGKEIVEVLLVEGMAKVKQVEEGLASGEDPKKVKAIKSAMTKLLVERFLKPVHPYHTVNPTDRRITKEQQKMAELKGAPKPKEIAAAKLAVADDFAEQEERERDEMRLFATNRKRKGAPETTNHRGSKKQVVEEQVYDDEMTVRVNYDRFDLKIRNRLLEQACRRRFDSKEAASVLRAMMSAAEGDQWDCRQAVSDPIAVHNIVQRMGDRASDLRQAFEATPHFRLQLKSTPDLVQEMLLVMACDDDLSALAPTVPTVDWVVRQMNPRPMVVCRPSGTDFAIDYATCGVDLRKNLVVSMVKERYGLEGARLMRILMQKGKLEEKHLAKFSLMPLKDVRLLCTKLLAASLIELQEVPKTADRAPSRTFHLFFVDFGKLCAHFLESLYQAQANVMARKAAERAKMEALIEKSARTDVKNDPKLLTPFEREQLRGLERKLGALETAVLRIESDVFVLKELPWLP